MASEQDALRHPHDGYAYDGCRCVCCTNVRALAERGYHVTRSDREARLERAARQVLGMASCYCTDPFPIADKHQPACQIWLVEPLRALLSEAPE